MIAAIRVFLRGPRCERCGRSRSFVHQRLCPECHLLWVWFVYPMTIDEWLDKGGPR